LVLVGPLFFGFDSIFGWHKNREMNKCFAGKEGSGRKNKKRMARARKKIGLANKEKTFLRIGKKW
jgi:hypothetical protein